MTIHNRLAQTPPMGWNSWDCYGTNVREAEVRANAAFMSTQLRTFGWEYIVVDHQWYEPEARAGWYRDDAVMEMDGYGRFVPATNRFPSAAAGDGFSTLAADLHRQGLKFGIHLMRGIPRQAVARNLPILGTPFHAQDIADPSSICAWNNDMFGVKLDHPGAQAYYDSVIALYAGWGIDFIKIDDLASPYHAADITAYAGALQRCGRPIVLSLSPGNDVPIDRADHLREHCEMWRISADFWDRWEDLVAQFAICRRWVPYSGPGYWADADMLPLGRIGIRAQHGPDRQSHLTMDEQVTLMTLWTICRSPLMYGGDLPSMDPWTFSLLTNPEVLAVNQASTNNREIFRDDNVIAWGADSLADQSHYLAVFNLGGEAATIEVPLSDVDRPRRRMIRNLWTGQDQESCTHEFLVHLRPHAAGLYRLTPL
jgi:alpha-galactosidase